jgi:hypothetical protein
MTSYDDYRSYLTRVLAEKSLSTQREFGWSVLERILPYVEKANKDALWDEERMLVESAAETVRSGSFDIIEIERIVKRFETLAQEDDVHAIETDSDIVDFLCGLESLVALERQRDTQAAARISESLMNILDQYFTEETPLSAWLTTPEIKNEFDQQIEFLRQRA